MFSKLFCLFVVFSLQLFWMLGHFLLAVSLEYGLEKYDICFNMWKWAQVDLFLKSTIPVRSWYNISYLSQFPQIDTAYRFPPVF